MSGMIQEFATKFEDTMKGPHVDMTEVDERIALEKKMEAHRQAAKEADRRNQRRRFAEAALSALEPGQFGNPHYAAKLCWGIADEMMETESE